MIVYKTTNLVNGKIYIGVHRMTLTSKIKNNKIVKNKYFKYLNDVNN